MLVKAQKAKLSTCLTRHLEWRLKPKLGEGVNLPFFTSNFYHAKVIN